MSVCVHEPLLYEEVVVPSTAKLEIPPQAVELCSVAQCPPSHALAALIGIHNDVEDEGLGLVEWTLLDEEELDDDEDEDEVDDDDDDE